MKHANMLPKDFISQMSAKTSDQLFAFGLSLTKDRQNAEDLYQDTIFSALKNNDKFRQGTNFMAWMKTIMRNLFINGYRRNKRFQAYVNEQTSVLSSRNLRARNLAESSLQVKELNHLIDNIDERFSTPFLMYNDGFSYDEIAQQLELPLGTVKSRIFIARRRLQASYDRITKLPVAKNKAS